MIRATTGIPHGNAVVLSSGRRGGMDELVFMPDPHGGTEVLWFCFRLERFPRAPRGRRVRLVLANVHNLLGGGWWEDEDPRTIRPVVRRPGSDWERLGAGAVVREQDGRFHVAWETAGPAPWMDIAVCYPYGRPELDGLLRDTRGSFTSDTVGLSQGGRPLVRLSNGGGEEGSARPGLFVTARQHSGETPGSWVMDGLLRRMASLGRRAPLVWAVPFVDLDGVERGDYGKDNFPWDLNRAWGDPPMRHETLFLQHDFLRWKKRCRPVLTLDLHGPGATEAYGTYVSLPGNYRKLGRGKPTMRMARRLMAALGNFGAPRTPVTPGYLSRWNTARFDEFAVANGVPSFVVEIPYALARGRVLTRETYREMGAKMASILVS